MSSTLLANLRGLKAGPEVEIKPRGHEVEKSERAEGATETAVQHPAKMEQMKKGPKGLGVEQEKTAPAADTVEADLVANALKLDVEIEGIKLQMKDAVKALEETKKDREQKQFDTVKTLYEVMEAKSRPVIRLKDVVVAIDKRITVKAANLSPQAKKKMDVLNQRILEATGQISEARKEIEELTLAQFEKFGGKESEMRRVSTFPSQLASAVAGISQIQAKAFAEKNSQLLAGISAGFLDVLKGFWKKLKGVFSGIEKMVEEAESLLEMI